MIQKDVVIIGSGLFGSMTAKHLRASGLDVVIIDSREPWSASKCSFGVYKDGWVAKLMDFVTPSLNVIGLHTFVGQKTFFDMNKEEEYEMPWIDCGGILNEEFVHATVNNIKNNVVEVRTKQGRQEFYRGKLGVVVCAGAWTTQILTKSGYKNFSMDRLWGATIEVKKAIDVSRIHQWAPYKQSVLLKKDKGHFVFGDGATVKNPVTGDKRLGVVGDRLMNHLFETAQTSISADNITSVNEGVRPYIKDYEFIKKHDNLLWSATGGAKNSTVLCGYIAQSLLKQIAG